MKEQQRSGGVGILGGVLGRKTLTDVSPELGLPNVTGQERGCAAREEGRQVALLP